MAEREVALNEECGPGGSDILQRLRAALERRPERESLTPGALEAKKEAAAAAHRESLTPGGACTLEAKRAEAAHRVGPGVAGHDATSPPLGIHGLQQLSPSPSPVPLTRVIAPFSLLPSEGWGATPDEQGDETAAVGAAENHQHRKEEVAQDLFSQWDRHASVDHTPDRSASGSPRKPAGAHKSVHAVRAESAHKSVHAARAEAWQAEGSITPGTLAPLRLSSPAARAHTSPALPLGWAAAAVAAERKAPLGPPGHPEPPAGGDQSPSRPPRRRDLTPPDSTAPPSPPPLIVDDISLIKTETHEVDEVTMETLVMSGNQAVQHVVVAGCGRQYMACLVTLKVERGEDSRLAPDALHFARANGSEASTVDQAKTCAAFHQAMLKGFTVCNKTLWETSKRTNAPQKLAQLRRYTILPTKFTPVDETLRPDGSVDRARVLELYADVVESMYGAATTGTADPVSVTPLHPSIVAQFDHLPSDADYLDVPQGHAALRSYSQQVPQPDDYSGNESESTSSTLDAQAAASQHQGDSGACMAPMTPHANIYHSQLLSPARSLPKMEPAPYVFATEPRPSAGARLCSYLKTFMPCLGPHSQALDDDILNPGHTIVKRAEPGKRSKPPKKSACKEKGPGPESFGKDNDGIFDGTTEGCEEDRCMRQFAPRAIEFSPTLMQGQAADVDMSMTPDTSMMARIGSQGHYLGSPTSPTGVNL